MRRSLLLPGMLAALGCGLEGLASAPSVPATITWRSCPSPSESIRWLGVRDGTGPWRHIAGSGGVYTFQVDSGRAGVAYNIGQLTPETTVRYYTAEELQAFSVRCYSQGVPQSHLPGTVLGLARAEHVDISLNNAAGYASGDAGAGPWPFMLDDVATGPADLIATRHSNGCYDPDACAAPTGMIIRRNIAVAAGSSLPPLDFSSPAELFALVPRRVTVADVASGEVVSVEEEFVTATTRRPHPLLRVGGSSAAGPSLSSTYYAVPDDRVLPGDEHRTLLTSRATGVSREGLVFKRAWRWAGM